MQSVGAWYDAVSLHLLICLFMSHLPIQLIVEIDISQRTHKNSCKNILNLYPSNKMTLVFSSNLFFYKKYE